MWPVLHSCGGESLLPSHTHTDTQTHRHTHTHTHTLPLIHSKKLRYLSIKFFFKSITAKEAMKNNRKNIKQIGITI